MPYYITNKHPKCKSGWATVNSSYELKACHKTKKQAVDHMVAISIAQNMKPGGTFPKDRKKEGFLSLFKFFTESANDSYQPPQGVQNAAKRALKWISEGKAGPGFTDVGRKRATQLASGDAVSRDVVGRMKSYFSRHSVDKKATGFNSGEKGFPTPGRVAWDAWGGDAGAAWVARINLDNNTDNTSGDHSNDNNRRNDNNADDNNR